MENLVHVEIHIGGIMVLKIYGLKTVRLDLSQAE